jgi:hypothetical protein
MKREMEFISICLIFVRMRKLLGTGVCALSYRSFWHTRGFVSKERTDIYLLVLLPYLAIALFS